jgi:hypothetical protein
MKKVYLQYWEESERGWGIRPDGCCLHLTKEDHKKYVDSIYKERESHTEIPYEYDRPVGEPIEVMIKDDLFSSIEEGSLRLMEYQMNNLLNMEEIVIL